jgi:hypothetical protein
VARPIRGGTGKCKGPEKPFAHWGRSLHGQQKSIAHFLITVEKQRVPVPAAANSPLAAGFPVSVPS